MAQFLRRTARIAGRLNVDTVVILGALLADTRTPALSRCPGPPTPESARFFGLQESRYEGPTGIAGVFQDACVTAGIRR